MNDLKPCPLCGGKARYVELTGRYAVECTRHCAATRIMGDKKKVAECGTGGQGDGVLPASGGCSREVVASHGGEPGKRGW